MERDEFIKATGGPAFPSTIEDNKPAFTYLGMTLRDYMAAKMLAQWDSGMAVCDHPTIYDRFAIHCYRMADAMLRARGQS